ncbi:hypothetical protein JVU11DRAFT_11624 [Chiua virens]|nr:hypothetical protein JVU11DRAFT_11624 [Chiua virens]
MNSDATEAALGLLGLSPFNTPPSHPQPQPHPLHHVAHAHGPSLTSTSVGIAIDRTNAPPIIQSALPPSLVPLKRKQPSPALSTSTSTPTPLTPSFSRDGLSSKPRQASHPLTSSTPPLTNSNRPLPNVSTKPSTAPSQRLPQQPSQLPPPSPSTSQHLPTLSDVPPPPDSEAISCICGFTYDDGFSIACDDCSRWCHAACFGIVQGEVPEFWKCWVCDPALVVDKERAGKIQKGRQKALRTKASHGTNGGVPGAANGVGGNSDEGSGVSGKPASRRKTSPGAERKSRRGSAVAAAIEGSGSSRKKRRASILSPANPSSPSILPPNPSTQAQTNNSRISYPNGNGPSTSSTLPPTSVKFPPDIYPNPSIYSQLLRVAKAWRGVTALNPPSPLAHPPPKTYNDREYIRVDSQGYQDRYGYSMSPLDNTTPVILDENVGEAYVPRTVLRTDSPISCPNQYSGMNSQYPPPSTTCTPAHLRPPSPRLHVAPDPSLPHSIYPSPPISNYMATPVPSSSHRRPCAKSPLAPSTNTIASSNSNDTIMASTLLAPYTATIVPSAAYLADPLNGYAHLGMGKPQVRLVGGGWEVGLDARGVGGVPELSDSGEKGNGLGAGKEDVEDGKARWARCGCWPNAVVRPVICAGTKQGERKQGMRMRHKAECAEAASHSNTISKDSDPPRTVNCRSVPPPVSRMQAQQTDEPSDQDDAPSASDSDVDPTTLSFGLFALRDLRADEEIVLGWEWDDGHAVHTLPALMESPGMFAPAHLHHLRAQFTSILHALSSTFTTCACGSSTRDCAVRVMERVVEGRSSEGESSDSANGEYEDAEEDVDVEGNGYVDLRQSRNWGLGMNVDMDIEMDTSIDVDRPPRRAKKRKIRKSGKGEDKVQADGCRDASTTVPPVKQRTRKPIDLGPLVGIKRGFRTREKAPMNGGWGGVEIVPSSLSAFPEIKTDEFHPDIKWKGKARMADDQCDVEIGPSGSTLPPRMRKAWPRSLASQTEPSQEDLPLAHSNRPESWSAYERWRSPDANAESPLSVSGVAEGSSVQDVDPRQGSMNMNGDGEDGADGQETETDTETEADGLDDTRQMPPPPMPASLDPTTISSLAHAHAVRSASPRGSIQWDKNIASAALIPPRTPASTPASSGRSGQSPGQGTPTSTPTPVNSTVLRPAPSRATSVQRKHMPSPNRPHNRTPCLLVASVSPSAPFSKLSLHSPDTTSSSHFTPGESTSSSLSPASTWRTPDHQISSPPSHRPSKPLHVHPQNEPPALSASLSAPAVTLNPPDSVRETPAEAQYQQPYRSSPDSRRDSPPSDAEEKRPANGEVYRVRFASPEILNGLSRLATKVTSDKSEPPSTEDGATAKGDAIRVVKEQEGPTMDDDAMDVDVDVVGEDQGKNGVCPPYVASPESSVNHKPKARSPLLDVPNSPHLQALSDSLSYSIPAVVDGAVAENGLSQVAPDVNEKTSEAKPMAVDPDPAQPVREPSSPPPKVKMSLKDFALRKKKQREEEIAAKALRSPVTSDGPGLLSSPTDDTKRDLANEQTDGVQATESDRAINGHGVKMDDANQDDVDSTGALHVNANGVDGDEGQWHDVGDSRRHEKKGTEVDCNVPAETPSTSTSFAIKGSDNTQCAQPLPSSTTSSRAPEERNHMDRTQTPVDGKPPATLTAKMEIMDAILPSGLVGADDRTPDVVSFAPDPPPPPLTIKQTSETTSVDRTVPITPAASTPTSMSTSSSTSVVNSRSNSVGVTSNSNPSPHALTLSSSIPVSRRPSHEDGEITSSTPPKTYLPQSHTPPTQPRSFHVVHPSPPIGSTSSSTTPALRRPAPPLSRSPLSSAAGPTPPPISSRPLPSGPRALRGSMSQPTHSPSYASSRPPYVGSQYIPRGPSADRDWERGDRQWTAQARTRGRAGSNGWGR